MIRPQRLRAVGHVDRLEGLPCLHATKRKLEWPAGCQSCVRIDVIEALDERVDDRNDLVAAFTASNPPGQKSFWTSITISALIGLMMLPLR
jgi:hypothetical protein